jgi:hypothetical protein
MKKLCEIAASRDEALAQLKELSADLYAKAIVVDNNMYPTQMKLATETPPLAHA